MKKLIVVLAATLFACSLVVVSVAADEKPAVETKKVADGKKPSVKKQKTLRVTATVEAVDLENRIVTVKGSEGTMVDIKAGPQVRNLAQVKVGDRVEITYYESIAVKVFKPGEMPLETVTATGAVRPAKSGKKPAGVVASQTTITAVITSISPDKASVTLKLADGKFKVAKIEDKKNLDNVKVGDEVMITITETMALAVKPAKKK